MDFRCWQYLAKWVHKRILKFLDHENSSNQKKPRIVRMNTSLDRSLPKYELPKEYRLHHYSKGDEEKWLELLNASKEFGVWEEDRLSREMLADLLPNGGTMVQFRNKYVACAAVCHRQEYSPLALLMYVVVLPEHRTKGLGKIVTIESMTIAQHAGYHSFILHTEENRIPAINMYISLEFRPDYTYSEDTRFVWETIFLTIHA
jgi:ribosomal protein S18 acetylase RimI-like enzyme